MSSSSAATASASVTAIRRLHRDLETLSKSRNPQLVVRPSDNMLQWHFVMHSLPSDTPYHGGCYHGKIIFPEDYPHKPPSIIMITPSGRLEVGMRLCLSMTDYHPESWNPAWSVETILVGLLSYFISEKETGYGSLKRPAEVRRQLAEKSWEANAKDAVFKELFPEFLERPLEESAAAAEEVEIERVEEGSPDGESKSPANAQDAGDGAEANRDAEQGNSAGDSGSAAAEAEGGQGDIEAGAADDDDDEANECWICRDTSSDEPLIQPCACRGSMSRVHASCVEQWIAHHRQNAVNNGPPRCSVCQQPYAGQEVRPGVGQLAGQACCDCAKQVLRAVVLVVVIFGFRKAADPDADLGPNIDIPLPVRIVIIVAFSVLFLFKVIALSVSLPAHRPPPRNCLRFFFVADQKQFATHLSDTLTSLLFLGLFCLTNALKPWYFFPYLAAFVFPMIRICCPRGLSRRCFANCIMVPLIILSMPFILVAGLVVVVYRHPRRVVHPLDAGWHIMVAIAGTVLCLTCDNNIPILCLWGAHSVLVMIGLLEQLLIRRLQWHKGPVWWFTLHLSALTAYLATVLYEPMKGLGAPNDTLMVVRYSSCAWLLLVAGFVLKTNWSSVIWAYRNWQQRHGHFTLDARPPAGADGAAVAGGNGRPGAILPT